MASRAEKKNDYAHANRWKSAIDLSFNTSPVSQQRKSRTHPSGKPAGSKPFEFVPASQVQRLAARVYAHRQQLGFSTISFGDSGGDAPLEKKKPPSKITRAIKPRGQGFGSSTINLGDVLKAACYNRPVQRRYPGKSFLGASNVSTSLVPPPMPRSTLPTRLGQENLDQSLTTLPGAAMRPPLPPTKLGEEHLSPSLVPPPNVTRLRPSRILQESSPPPASAASRKAPARGWHTSHPALNPPQAPKQQPAKSLRDTRQLFNRESVVEASPPAAAAARASYPAPRVPGGGAPGGAHGCLSSHLGAGTNSVDVEVGPPRAPPRRAASFGGPLPSQRFGAESVPKSRWATLRRTRMGISSLTTATLG